jgi:ABC-type transporter Mla maintaining outer membrane lipid asymmetry permease subunit MlaE
MESLNHLWDAVRAVVTHSDYVSLGIIAVIAIAAGFIMDSFASLVTVTVLALVVYGIAGYVEGVALHGQNASAYATTTLHNLEVTQMLTVLAYAVTFAVLIGVVHVIRSLVLR